MEVKEGGSSEGGQGAPSMAHTAWKVLEHSGIFWLLTNDYQ
jgi:hypothetical protein